MFSLVGGWETPHIYVPSTAFAKQLGHCSSIFTFSGVGLQETEPKAEHGTGEKEAFVPHVYADGPPYHIHTLASCYFHFIPYT